MKNIFILSFLITSLFAYGQSEGSNQTTSLCGGHWEFFMSEIAVKLTFKMDKYTGDVFQLVEKEDKTLTWQSIKKDLNIFDIAQLDQINYQLFSSGKGIRHTYLLNTNTGLTWQLVKDKNDNLHFQMIE